MRSIRLALLVVVAVVVTGAFVVPNVVPLRAAGDDAAMQAKDRDAIEALMWRYARALDTRNADAYVSCYTPDGEFIAGANPTKGTAALHKMIADLKKSHDDREKAGEPQPAMYHMEMNKYVEFIDATHARHHTYWQTVFGAVGRGGKVNVAAAGNAVDDLVKVNGRWLIRTRNVTPGTTD